MPDLAQRLTRLEELNFFQEQRLKELDVALLTQQSQLDTLEKKVADALAVIRLLQEKLSEQPDNSLPPHFMPERY
ncbi:SlyX family protein [uncultured Desulfovibrio sp.]|uniref:SlyX family protein n=1 Tax=uncultured Desulfovibrio sp. TaxID=167968 RepID=UPI0026386769|nr:SlyX family protein [uncultured Desulfovibrio sp.]